MYLYIIHRIYRLYQLPVTSQSVPTFPVTAYRSIKNVVALTNGVHDYNVPMKVITIPKLYAQYTAQFNILKKRTKNDIN